MHYLTTNAFSQDNLLNSKLNVRMGKKGDLSNFERGTWLLVPDGPV